MVDVDVEDFEVGLGECDDVLCEVVVGVEECVEEWEEVEDECEVDDE